MSVAWSKYTGRGRRDEGKSYLSGCSVYDPTNGALLLRLTGLRYHKLDAAADANARQTYNRSVWKPDISLISQDQLTTSISMASVPKVHQVMDLVAHKKPNLKIMEIQLSLTESADTSSIWFDGGERSSRAAYRSYSFVSSDPKVVLGVRETYTAARNAQFTFVDITKPDFAPTSTDFDLVLVRFSAIAEELMAAVAQNVRKLLIEGGYALFVEQGSQDIQSDSTNSDIVVINGEEISPSFDRTQMSALLSKAGFGKTLNISCETVKSAFLSVAGPQHSRDFGSAPTVNIVHLVPETSAGSDTKTALAQSGWHLVEHVYPFTKVQPKSTVLILDEFSSPVLTTVSGDQWDAIKKLMNQGCKVLWVTKGSQIKASQPDCALVHGLFRTIRAEDPSMDLATLDLECGESPVVAAAAIDCILELLLKPAAKEHMDYEYAQRDGIFYVNRILPDGPLNRFKTDEVHGAEPVYKALHDTETVVRLRAERVGTLAGLQFAELSAKELPMEDGKVEVEIYAVGLNFKVSTYVVSHLPL